MENHGQKRSVDDQVDVLDGVQAILLDIEGTTTPISFVKEKLFPYVRSNIASYLSGHYGDEECVEDVAALREQATTDADMKGCIEIPTGDEENEDAVVKAAVASVLWQMDADRKTTALKQLQGHMWREAYKTGLLQGELFDDVVPALKSWIDEGKRIYLYSSGSVEAQKLLFSYSEKGNFSKLISEYFDTTTGEKTEKESYSKIIAEMDVKAEQVAFFTDLPSEACPAAEAGCKVVLVVREGNAELSADDKQKYNTVSSFSELSTSVAPPAKRIEAVEAEGELDDDEVDDDEVDDDVDGSEEAA